MLILKAEWRSFGYVEVRLGYLDLELFEISYRFGSSILRGESKAFKWTLWTSGRTRATSHTGVDAATVGYPRLFVVLCV